MGDQVARRRGRQLPLPQHMQPLHRGQQCRHLLEICDELDELREPRRGAHELALGERLPIATIQLRAEGAEAAREGLCGRSMLSHEDIVQAAACGRPRVRREGRPELRPEIGVQERCMRGELQDVDFMDRPWPA